MKTAIPDKCTVLIMGGGPGGSYAACVLAREGIDCVVLEADSFPRYHIGESMLASFRHYMRFIDLDSTFDAYGFTKKVGAAFKLNGHNREGYNDFIAAAGQQGYTWNVVRSEADDLIFKHARASGAKTFDRVRVTDVQFVDKHKYGDDSIGRPTSASWASKSSGLSGTITFEYLVDATGRAGIISTRYLKNREFNGSLKNVATWAYWKNTGAYGVGTERENVPYFEALRDQSGWTWLIPLHDGTTSVGIVMNQQMQVDKKKGYESPSSKQLYLDSLNLAPSTKALLGDGEMVTDVKQASDYSYQASVYAGANYRIVGDAGAFIDPFFSSGVHLALTTGLSAAITIVSSINGFNELKAAKWHTNKTKDGYIHFLLAVLSAYKQMMNQNTPVLNDFDEDGFDKAFALFRPIISGTVESDKRLTTEELTKTIQFCANALNPTFTQERFEVMKKLESKVTKMSKMHSGGMMIESYNEASRTNGRDFTEDDLKVIKQLDAQRMLRTKDSINIDSFSTQAIDGYVPLLERGRLGLVPAIEQSQACNDVFVCP